MNRADFEHAALQHLDACYRVALQLTRRPDEASDLVQEAYLRAFQHIERSSGEGFQETGGGLRSWLFTIIHHTHYSRQSKSARSPALSGDIEMLVGAPASNPNIADAPPPAWDLRSLNWEHVDSRLKKAIDALPPEQREVLLLWGVEGMKYREIAAVTGVAIGTVMSRLHRARSTLADLLEDFRREAGWDRKEMHHR